MNLSTKTASTSHPEEIAHRIKVAETRTTLMDGFVYDMITGECYGSYTKIHYSPDPVEYPASTPKNLEARYYIDDDGTPVLLTEVPPRPYCVAQVLELFPTREATETNVSSTPGPKPQTINNPLATILCIHWLEHRPTPWLDDIVFGAIYTGPGIINGKQSVSFADVKKLLRLPIISTASAAECLLNQDRQPMSARQLQRVVQAARIALRGIALYLERAPDILESVDVEIDFNPLWKSHGDDLERSTCQTHPLKHQALEMIRSEVPKRTIATKLGISKNTVKKWASELHGPAVDTQRMGEGGGQ